VGGRDGERELRGTEVGELLGEAEGSDAKGLGEDDARVSGGEDGLRVSLNVVLRASSFPSSRFRHTPFPVSHPPSLLP
jgi:hypothetical protein